MTFLNIVLTVQVNSRWVITNTMKGPNETAETRQTINARRVIRRKLKLLHFTDPSTRSRQIVNAVTAAGAEADKTPHAISDLLALTTSTKPSISIYSIVSLTF